MKKTSDEEENKVSLLYHNWWNRTETHLRQLPFVEAYRLKAGPIVVLQFHHHEQVQAQLAAFSMYLYLLLVQTVKPLPRKPTNIETVKSQPSALHP
jgi:hypothetical protein